MAKKQYILMILDGVGLSDEEKGNAFKLASTPNIDKYISKYANSHIATSGLAVGLPEGQMGNSEVGHTNIGAGRICYQELTRISKEIEEGEFFKNEELVKAIKNVKENNSSLHLMGLLSDGGVHSHNSHLYALLKLAKQNGIEKVYIHAFLDGRDTPPTSGTEYIKELNQKIREIGVGKISTLSGRYYAMDRDSRWEREKLAYDAIAYGIGNKFKNAEKAIENSYEAEEFDEFVKPIVIVDDNGEPVSKVENNDSVIFFNFRPDRARQLARIFTDEEFNEFETKKYENLVFVTMTKYDESLKNVLIAYKPQVLVNTFGEYISRLGMKQLRIAETEKYAHVTFFFNGGEEKQYPGEDRILVPSPKVATYDMQPEMSAREVTEKVVEAINADKYDTIILNFANPDMVGHTGSLPAAIKAVETIDECVGKVVKAMLEHHGTMLITADHGNCEQMIDYATGEPHTAHTTNPVPLILVTENTELKIKEGKLADLAPTMLELLNIEKPEEMTGESILVK